jgi:hypothetical protein
MVLADNSLASAAQRLLAQILPVKRQEVEHEIADRGMRGVDMLLQRFEIRLPVRQNEGDFAVEQGAFYRQGQRRLGDRREAHRPVEAAAAEQGDVVAGLPRDDAVAVVFHLMQPAGAGRHVGVERGELGLDEVRN